MTAVTVIPDNPFGIMASLLMAEVPGVAGLTICSKLGQPECTRNGIGLR
jgi:hypothetical protein